MSALDNLNILLLWACSWIITKGIAILVFGFTNKFWKAGESQLWDLWKVRVECIYGSITAEIHIHTLWCSFRRVEVGKVRVSVWYQTVASELFSLCLKLDSSEIFWSSFGSLAYVLTMSKWLVDFLWVKMKQFIV